MKLHLFIFEIRQNYIITQLPDSLPVTKLDWDYDICEHASISKHEFLQKLKVNHTESQSVKKSTRKQME